MAREGNNPKRRVIPRDPANDSAIKALLDSLCYVGSGHHKRYPLDYGFERTNPVPTKSLCDIKEPIELSVARRLFQKGISAGIMSDISSGHPKYIWSVDEVGTVFEAKTDRNGSGQYHGYPLELEDDFRHYILKIWKERCG